MKILFLGTSAGWPLPRLGCQCKLCSSCNPKDKRLRPVILIDESILIDCGPDIYHQLIKNQVDTSKLKALIITHSHLDHILGFYDLGHLYNRQQKELKLITTQGVLNDFHKIYPYPLHPFRPQIVKPDETFDFEKNKISLVSVFHSRRPCFGVKIKTNRILAYVPDFRKIPKTSQKTLGNVDLLILDGSSLDKRGQSKNHISIKQGLEIARKLQPKKVYFTHLGHITGLHQELEAFIQKEGGSKFHLAYDGLEINL